MAVRGAAPRLRFRILLPLAGILLVLVVFSIVSAYFLQRHHLEAGVRRQMDSVPRLWTGLLDNEGRHIGNLLTLAMEDQGLLRAFAARDRAALLAQAAPVLAKLRPQSHITHFYFLLPDRTCFLRVHNPGRYGDTIDRYTLNRAASEGAAAHGIELGPFGTFTLRVVQPVRQEGRLLGFVEFGRDIAHLTPELKKLLGMDFFLLVNHRHLDRARWEEGLRMLGRRGEWEQLPRHVIIDQTMEEIPDLFRQHISLPHEEKEALIMKMTLREKTVWGGFIPLREAGGQDVGEIIALQDVTSQVAEQRAAALFTVASVLLAAGLFAGFALHVIRMEKGLLAAHDELARYQGQLEELVAERTRELALYRRIVDVTRDLMAYVDRDYVYRAVNAEYCRLLGLRSEEIIGRTVSEVRGEELFRTTFKVPLDLALAGEQVRYEKWFSFAAGERRYLDVTYTPFMGRGEEPEGVVVSIRDITARKRAEDALGQANQELEQRVAARTEELQATYRQLLHAEKLSAMGKLTASLAHELNNPLCGIGNVLEGLHRREAMDGEDRAMVELAISECQRVTKLISDMQAMNRPTSGAQSPLALHPLLDSMLRLCDKECRRHHIRVVRDYAENLPLVLAVEDQLKQVMLNLFTNAVAAMEEEGGILAVETAFQGGQVVVRVEDTGPGIRPEDLGRIFEPFFTTKPAGKGTGLGLPVSYGIIEQHGGTITVQSEPGQGTVFTVTLPACETGEETAAPPS
ncbi:MAG: ATP-binding protein [Thermodesulfobacteriota bacterium]